LLGNGRSSSLKKMVGLTFFGDAEWGGALNNGYV